ncbi:outer membrane beta-barrel protein [Vulgatibacter incomptus]|nr:outer membrane beta-barrel protein [Vulgatibacter incomptus]
MRNTICLLLALGLPCFASAQEAPEAEVRAESPPAGTGLSVEGGISLVVHQDPLRVASPTAAAWSLRLGYDLGRHLGLSRGILFDAGLLWSTTSSDEGTRDMRVSRTLDAFALPLRFGLSPDLPGFPLRLSPYLTAGPAATIVSVDYAVNDPLGRGPTGESQSALQWGAAYGVGLGLSLRDAGAFRPVGRLELTNMHRSYYSDFAATFGLGFEI